MLGEASFAMVLTVWYCSFGRVPNRQREGHRQENIRDDRGSQPVGRDAHPGEYFAGILHQR